MKYDYDLLVIGGGSGGLSIASAAAQMGVKVLLVDKDEFGGDCLHSGCVPSKSLIKTAKVAQSIRDGEKYGLKKQEPLFDWENVTGRINNIQEVIQEHDSSERFQSLGADTIYGMAKFLDDHSVSILLNNKLVQNNKYDEELEVVEDQIKVSAKRIVIATGSSPKVIRFEGLDTVGYITNENLFVMEEQPKSLLVVGGGVIGVEMAQAFARLGTDVTIFLRGEYVLEREDQAISKIIQERLKKEEVTIITNGEIQKFGLNGDLKQLKYSSEGIDKTADFTEVLMATGRKFNTNLDLEKAGVEYGKKGIPVDTKLRTNKKHIYAIGDVNGINLFTHAANYEAGIVFMNAVLGIPSKANHDSIGYTVFTNPEIASIGINESVAQKKGIQYELIENKFSAQDRALTESEIDGVIRILVDKKTRVLGCQIVSPRAGEMIREWQLIISQKMKLSKVAQSTYIYPTYGEHSKWTAGKFLAPKLFNPKMKKLFRVLRGFRA